jgi:hypothetical protein
MADGMTRTRDGLQKRRPLDNQTSIQAAAFHEAFPLETAVATGSAAVAAAEKVGGLVKIATIWRTAKKPKPKNYFLQYPFITCNETAYSLIIEVSSSIVRPSTRHGGQHLKPMTGII